LRDTFREWFQKKRESYIGSLSNTQGILKEHPSLALITGPGAGEQDDPFGEKILEKG